ncbi:hypothetical protein CXF68_18305 [Tenacibaculum sp. Bg11-29]|uniref:hypothetical protein n=1 Tax=Tenacibaculum sp. Bg11-29 TaxID=2058306 RepID=UPI000C33689E|nr:hypothetical protein [Tenacibaculum sp. Bg11-29]PKH52529.1 hypothetical protein CXF68_18305 [Tenacibaculum sp. Bg11-29]
MENLTEKKHTLGREILSQLAIEALAAEKTIKTIKFKLKLGNADRGYMGLNKKNNGNHFICDVSEKDAAIFNIKTTKYTKKDHFTYELKDNPYKGNWLDYHTGSGEIFAESHSWIEKDIAIWQYKDKKLQALIGKKFGELPICGEKDSVLMYASARMNPFEMTVEEVK